MDKLNEVLRRQKRQVENPAQVDADEVEQLVGFIVGEEEYAIPILYIKEIINGESYIALSEEEKEALKSAINMKNPLAD